MIFQSRDFEMADVHRYTGPLPDFQHLFYRFCQGIPFAPDMTGEIAAVLAAYFCQKDKILGLAETFRRVHDTAGKPQRSCFHGVLHVNFRPVSGFPVKGDIAESL